MPDTLEIPEWANERIKQLREVEILLGNIPRDAKWRSEHVENVLASCADPLSSKPISEKTTEYLFKFIAVGLNKEGFTPSNISKAINSAIFFENGPKYCNEDEVKEVLL